MRIAEVVPLCQSVPPEGYGGTERVVFYLTEELVHQGHDVTLFASGDSMTSARLIAPCTQSLQSASWPLMMSRRYRMLDQLREASPSFDIIHFHSNFLDPVDFMHALLFKHQLTPYLTTLHWRLDLSELQPLYEEFRHTPVVSVADYQRETVPSLNWQGTVYHGLPADLYTLQEARGKYLAFLGRLAPSKGVHRAIQIAKGAGMDIKVAGNVLREDQEYFDQLLKPLLNDPSVEYVGEVSQEKKNEFLGNAYALLFPINWPEPFGIVMIEAMACGTPIIGYRQGSVPEVIQDGVNGFIVDGQEDAVEAIGRVPALSRRRCREVFKERFTASRMATDYLTIYEGLMHRQLVLDFPDQIDSPEYGTLWGAPNYTTVP